MNAGWAVKARGQSHLSCSTQSGRPKTLSVFILLGECRQSCSGCGAGILFELSSEPASQLLGQGSAVRGGSRRSCRSDFDWNLRSEHENAVAMPKRPNQIIPVALFHSTSTGDSGIITLTQLLAERLGFEPRLEVPLNTLSKRAPSATRPSLRYSGRTD